MNLYKKLNSLLNQAGLKEAEILVYIELLKNPAQTKWEVVERTGLDRNAVYRAFEGLEDLKMVESAKEGFKALSLKVLVSQLQNSSRKKGKLARRIKDVAPFLHCPADSVEEIETFYTPDQIVEPYLFIAQRCGETNLDFGDFENFIPKIGGLDVGREFRKLRIKKSKHHAICTTHGKHTDYFCTNDFKKKFKTQVDQLNLNFKGTFIIFSDTENYILFNHFKENDVSSVLVKSKIIADIQRSQFNIFSQLIEN